MLRWEKAKSWHRMSDTLSNTLMRTITIWWLILPTGVSNQSCKSKPMRWVNRINEVMRRQHLVSPWSSIKGSYTFQFFFIWNTTQYQASNEQNTQMGNRGGRRAQPQPPALTTTTYLPGRRYPFNPGYPPGGPRQICPPYHPRQYPRYPPIYY